MNARRRPVPSLRARGDFLRVYREGRRRRGPSFLLHFAPNDLGTPRLGITTTRKIGGAVVRNRARRMVREAMRTLDAPPAEGWDLVLVVHRGLVDTPLSELRRQLAKVLASAGVPGAARMSPPAEAAGGAPC